MFCKKCGKEIADDATFCSSCGTVVNEEFAEKARVANEKNTNDTLSQIALIFMIIGCVVGAFAIIPLCWMIPMTVALNSKMKNHEPIGIGFKVCTLVFVSTVAGILLLCKTDDDALNN